MNDLETIEMSYQEFISNLTYSFEYHNIDYIGISLDAFTKSICGFKIYWSDHCTVEKEHWLTEWLRDQNMAQYVETVEHGGRTGKYQTDIRLQNRTDENMEHLFAILNQKEKIFSENESLIRSISRMPIAKEEKYEYASLYFLGMIFREKEKSEMLKFHWINRICKDTNRLYGDIMYDDLHFLNYLRALGIDPYNRLICRAEDIIRNCQCHLWMTGLDLAEEGWKKYKIYIKYPRNIYQVLEQNFLCGDIGCHVIAQKVRALETWIQGHTELQLEGTAFCTDTNGADSVNLYYGIQESYFEKRGTSYMDQ